MLFPGLLLLGGQEDSKLCKVDTVAKCTICLGNELEVFREVNSRTGTKGREWGLLVKTQKARLSEAGMSFWDHHCSWSLSPNMNLSSRSGTLGEGTWKVGSVTSLSAH